MANKRQLTGGTDDVNPQYLSGALFTSAADTLTSNFVPTPIARIGPMSGATATVMEVLKIFVNMPDLPASALAAGTQNFKSTLTFLTSDPGSTAVSLGNPKVFASFENKSIAAFTAAGTGMLGNRQDPDVWDCTDNAGHGLLVATDNIYVQCDTTNYGIVKDFNWKILYRFKKVALAEYIGIVQSQQ